MLKKIENKQEKGNKVYNSQFLSSRVGSGYFHSFDEQWGRRKINPAINPTATDT
jgi:hypothetical protein